MAEFQYGQLQPYAAETPYQLSSGLADVQAKQAQASYDQQTLPSRVAMQQSQLEQTQLANQSASAVLPVTQAHAKLEQAALQQNLIGNAMATFDPDAPDASARWDAMVDGLVDQGATQAGQFRGRYSPAMAQKWARAYSANSAGGSLDAIAGGGNTASSGLAQVAGGTMAGVTNGASVTDYDKLFAQVPPAQRGQAMQTARTKADAIMAAVSRVENSQDPQTAWAEEATAMGFPQAANLPPSQIMGKLQQLKDEYGPLDNYLNQRLNQGAAGIPAPAVPATLKEAGGGLYSIDESNPANPTAKELVEPKGNYSLYTDANGKTWKVDGRTGDMTPAEANVVAKVGGAGGRGGSGSVYAQKQAAWLAVHPGDQAGALDYAGGKAGAKAMTPAQIALASEKQATSELSALTLGGQPPADPVGWINNRKAEIESNLTAANSKSVNPAAPAGAPAASVQPPAQLAAQIAEGQTRKLKAPDGTVQTWTRKNGKLVKVS